MRLAIYVKARGIFASPSSYEKETHIGRDGGTPKKIRTNEATSTKICPERRSNIISRAKSLEYMTKAERAELSGLLKDREKFAEQYDSLTFTEEHLEFKAMHNDVFVRLAKYCERERNIVKAANENEPINYSS